jgi:predicted CopG family antitoxin
MGSKNIGIKEDVYERLKAHKRGDESFSETLDRLIHERESDWRTNAGFLSQHEADDLEAAVEQGLADLDTAFDEDGIRIDERLSEEP